MLEFRWCNICGGLMRWVSQVLIYTRQHGVKMVSEHMCLLPGHGSLIWEEIKYFLDASHNDFVEPLKIKAKAKGWNISMQDIHRILPVCSLIIGWNVLLQTSLTLTLDIGKNWMPSVDITDSFRSNGSHHPKWARVGENESRCHTVAHRTRLHSTLCTILCFKASDETPKETES